MDQAETEVISVVKSILGYQLFDVGGRPVTVSTILVATLVVLGALWLSRLLRRALLAFFKRRGAYDEGTVGVAERLLHYTVLVIGLGIAIHTVGINLSALFAAGAVFAVAIGFATQNIVQNFLSGIILLVERSIKPGDVLEVEGRRVKVVTMGIRATIVRTKDDEDLIVPNSILAGASVKNFTLRDPVYRLRMSVGVVYSSDMEMVHRLLYETAEALTWRTRDRAPEVYLQTFADSSVVFEVSVWTEDPWSFQRQVSDMNRAVWRALQQAQVVIAFPQLDLHLDPPVMAALGAHAAGDPVTPDA